MSDDIVFEEPPPDGRSNLNPAGRQPAVINQLRPLRDRPGEWARVWGPTSSAAAYSWASRLRAGAYAGTQADDYEAVAREIDGKGFVWARYVGNGTDR